jgi:hypothetical protein
MFWSLRVKGFVLRRVGPRSATKVNKFSVFCQNLTDSGRPNSKIAEFTVYCSKISEKDKNQQKICKKTRSNPKFTGEEFFVKPDHLGW